MPTTIEFQTADGKMLARVDIADAMTTVVSEGFRLVVTEDGEEPEIHDFQPD
jgi:hypothetical protein